MFKKKYDEPLPFFKFMNAERVSSHGSSTGKDQRIGWYLMQWDIRVHSLEKRRSQHMHSTRIPFRKSMCRPFSCFHLLHHSPPPLHLPFSRVFLTFLSLLTMLDCFQNLQKRTEKTQKTSNFIQNNYSSQISLTKFRI